MQFIAYFLDTKGNKDYVSCVCGTDQPEFNRAEEHAERFPNAWEAADFVAGALNRGDLEVHETQSLHIIPVAAIQV